MNRWRYNFDVIKRNLRLSERCWFRTSYVQKFFNKLVLNLNVCNTAEVEEPDLLLGYNENLKLN